MTLAEILALGRMGYTKADIDAMERKKHADDTNINTNQKPVAPAAPAAPVPPAPVTEFDRLMKRLDELTAAMQENNRAAAEMGANIINPRAAAIKDIAALGGYTINDKEE